MDGDAGFAIAHLRIVPWDQDAEMTLPVRLFGCGYRQEMYKLVTRG